jgi:hypothetical protein
MNLLKTILGWFGRLFRREPAPRCAIFVEGDELPEEIDPYHVTIAREGDTDWVAGFYCPCGCGKRLQLMLLDGVKPRWDAEMDETGRVSLHPSVWLSSGCKSHFWLRDGQVRWCP